MKRFTFFITAVLLGMLSACGTTFNETEVSSLKMTDSEGYETETDINVNGNIQEQEEAEKTEQSNPVSGGTLKVSMRPPKTLNPLINEDVTVDNVLKTVFEPLFTMNQTMQIVPNIAESYSFGSDGKTLSVKIKSGLSWQDGRAITADDVVFSLDSIKSTAGKSIYSDALLNVSGYSAKGDILTITYSKPYSYCIYNLCFPVIPKHYYDKKLAVDSDVSFKPLGSGSYKFLSYQIVHKLVLEKCSGINGMPYIDKIEAIITYDKETDLYSFEQGLTDVVSTDFSEWGKYSASRKTNSSEFAANNFEFLGFNFKNSVLNSLVLRQAIAYAIPYDEIVESIYLSNATYSATPINPKSWVFSEDAVKYGYDLQKAKELLSSSGLTKEQLTMSILVNSENNERCEVAATIANRLNQIGLSVTVNKQPFDNYMKMLQDDNFIMFMGGAKLSKNIDLSPFISSEAITSGINYFNYSDEQMNALLNAAEAAVGDENFKNAVGEIQKNFSFQLPCIGICVKDDTLMTSEFIKGEKTPVMNNIYNRIQKWYIQ